MTEINLQVEEKADLIDRYLSQHLSNLSRLRIQQLIEQGQVQVDGKVCTFKKETGQTGDRISNLYYSREDG